MPMISQPSFLVYHNGMNFGTYYQPTRRSRMSIICNKLRHRRADQIVCENGYNSIRGYFARSDPDGSQYDIFVGFITTRISPDPPARVYRVVWDDEITILGIYRAATDDDFEAARAGRVCMGVVSDAKNTDIFRVVNGVRITVIT